MRILLISWPCTLLVPHLFIILLMSLAVNWNNKSDSWVMGVNTEISTSILCPWTLLRKMIIEKFPLFFKIWYGRLIISLVNVVFVTKQGSPSLPRPFRTISYNAETIPLRLESPGMGKTILTEQKNILTLLVFFHFNY